MPKLQAIRKCWACGYEFDRSGCDCHYLVIRDIQGMKEKTTYICPNCTPRIRFSIWDFKKN